MREHDLVRDPHGEIDTIEGSSGPYAKCRVCGDISLPWWGPNSGPEGQNWGPTFEEPCEGVDLQVTVLVKVWHPGKAETYTDATAESEEHTFTLAEIVENPGAVARQLARASYLVGMRAGIVAHEHRAVWRAALKAREEEQGS